MCLNVLHLYGYAHTDAHLGNFLITDDGKIMLIDLDSQDSQDNNYYSDFFIFMEQFKENVYNIPKILLDLINVIITVHKNQDIKPTLKDEIKDEIVNAIHKTTRLSSEEDIYKLLCKLKSISVLKKYLEVNNSRCHKSFFSILSSRLSLRK
jgi:cellulose biosynthesis protein BcsQ